MTKHLMDNILKRDRLILLFSLIAVIALAWAYTIHLTHILGHSDMTMEMVSPYAHAWTFTDFYLNFLMWTVMQIAMMTPTAVPMLLFLTKINRNKHPDRAPYLETGLFLLGYLMVWTGFSFLATLVQWGLQTAALLSSTSLVRATPVVGGVLLIAAGFFQFSPLKNTCLTHCRTPVEFIMSRWQEGKRGAVLMGMKHGLYCVGCCWLLMVMLFAVGVMNVLWMAMITIFMLIEKIAPAGDRIGKGAGVLFILFGGWMILGI